MLQDAIALGVLVVVQEAIDIALHIASDEGWEHAASYRDAFVTLERHAILDAALAARLAAAAQLRNRIARGSASLDVDRLWSELPDGIEAFSASRGEWQRSSQTSETARHRGRPDALSIPIIIFIAPSRESA